MKKRVNEIGVEEIVGAGLSHEEAQNFHQTLTTILSSSLVSPQDPKEIWRQVCAQRLLQPSHPHALHQLIYHSTYAEWDASSNGPPIYWFPSREQAKHTNLGRMMAAHGSRLLGDSYKDPISSFDLFYKFSVDHSEVYWSLVLKELSVTFLEDPKCVLDASDKSKRGGRWLPGAVMNIAECCLFPIRKEDSSVAIMWRDEHLVDDSPVQSLTLKEIRDQVMVVANALDTIFSKGDTIAIYMPMTVNAVIVYLAIVLAGCVVVSIADSFAPKEMATRLRVSKAKGIFTQSCC